MKLTEGERFFFKEAYRLVAAIKERERTQREEKKAARIAKEKRQEKISQVVAKAKEVLAPIEPQSNRRWNNQGKYIGSGIFRISPFMEAVIKQEKTKKRLSVFVQDEGEYDDKDFILAAFINCGDPDAEVFNLFEVRNGEAYNHVGEEASEIEIDNALERLTTINSMLNPKQNKK